MAKTLGGFHNGDSGVMAWVETGQGVNDKGKFHGNYPAKKMVKRTEKQLSN
jgi:hypothetical protein